MRALFAFLAGSLFGAGLLVSGMTDTTKVQGWLDLFGAWDPTLAFVMGGAILPMAAAWVIGTRREKALLGNAIPAQSDPVIDARLLGGSALFGTGWALAGLCPGPAIGSLTWGGTAGLVFFAAMAAGMVGFRAFDLRGAAPA
ncbi:MAG: DUF6691 family protein [Pseudomonadota bacterium]